MVDRPRMDEADPLSWIREQMPVLRALGAAGEPLAGTTVAVSSHLEPSTGFFIETLAEAGAAVLATASEANSTHDDVVDYLDSLDRVETFADAAMDDAALDEAHRRLLDREPELLLTDGAELIMKAHDDVSDVADAVRGAAEQTTSGVSRVEAMADAGRLALPVYRVNHTPMKHQFDNVHGTGESALTNIAMTTNTIIAGRTVVVAGYGYVGRGVARKARDLGAETIVTEIDPRKALRARMDGHRVMPMDAAAAEGDLFVTATGNCRVIRDEHFDEMPDEAVLANVGHLDVEIDLEALADRATEVVETDQGITRYRLPDGRRLDVLARGRLVNLTGPFSQGHPAAVMDTTFGAMFVAGRHLDDGAVPDPGVHPLPEELDREIAELKLDTMGIDIDTLTDKQAAYLDSWDRLDTLAEWESEP
ncbi:MAG: adenosylhomocysteinase [Haloglomus sp.]